MKFFKIAKDFRKDESGAVTVDWVVLTAAIVALAIGLLGTIRSNTETVADGIADNILKAPNGTSASSSGSSGSGTP
ncbi:Flp family type IVb pilin [Oceaniovalibus guishaninsula]|nr:hypothetical protein [Oceaniovalibus guishaninsula]